ncbi:MAG: pyrroline-5-carboxylate reductase [Thermodesulfobacteriota bacterium]|nr:pyrroline-5-carboxylate reductase [Thermodesulfobacteriota bacterium]
MSTQKKTLGVIGLGNMGGAIVKGLSSRKDLSLVGFDLDKEKLEALKKYRLEPAKDLKELTGKCAYLILAVKPQHMRPVLKEISPVISPDLCLISIAAGITMDTLRKHSQGACPVVRVMPNTPAMVGAGVFALCLEDKRLKPAQKKFIPKLFSGIGQVHTLPEKLFDAFTAVAGSGPAYVFYFMEALIEAGVSLGLSRDQATSMVKALFIGSGKLADQSDRHISELREMVTSPGGATIAALNHMEESAVRGAVINAVIKACERSQELGK